MKPADEMKKKAEALVVIRAYRQAFVDYNNTLDSGSLFSTIRQVAGIKTPADKRALVNKEIEKLKHLEDNWETLSIQNIDEFMKELQTTTLENAREINPDSLPIKLSNAAITAKNEYKVSVRDTTTVSGQPLAPTTTATKTPLTYSASSSSSKTNPQMIKQGKVSELDNSQFAGHLTAELTRMKMGSKKPGMGPSDELNKEIDKIIVKVNDLRKKESPEEITATLNSIITAIEKASPALRSLVDEYAPKDKSGDSHNLIDQINQQIGKYTTNYKQTPKA